MPHQTQQLGAKYLSRRKAIQAYLASSLRNRTNDISSTRGVTTSRAEAAPPAASSAMAKPLTPGQIAARMQGKATPMSTVPVVDYLRLPPPVRYEELQREVLMTLKPDCFEGLRFEFSKPFNQNFAFTHSVYMGNMDVPTQNNQPIKMPMGTYEFGANLANSTGTNMMIGRIMTDGRLSGRIRYEVLPWLGLKLQMQLAEETGMSQVMFDGEFKGKDWNGQMKWGNNQFYGCNYFQSVTPNLALGGEAFYLGLQRKCGIGLAGRYTTPQSISTIQVASTKLISLSFAHKVSEKVSLASEMVWNLNAREATATFGYDYMLRQCRLRGRIDTDGKVGAYLEERINAGINFVLSAELDHYKKDYKFGFGMVVGE